MEDEFPDKINLDDLYTRKREIEKNRLQIYKQILNRVHKQIKISSRQKFNNQFTFFVIPEFLMGVPMYDIAACTAFIIDKLKENGFQIKYTYPNLLFISWSHHYDKFKRMQIKKLYGINIDNKGNVINKDSQEKDDKFTNNDANSMILRKTNNITIPKNKKEFKNINDYKPSGIYNINILDKIKKTIGDD
tara:strand:- start:100 stop:669 length:570 start_codon:yes stop_codon:yes gene_type:complete